MSLLDRFSGYPDTEERRPQREPPDFMQAAKERTEEEMTERTKEEPIWRTGGRK